MELQTAKRRASLICVLLWLLTALSSAFAAEIPLAAPDTFVLKDGKLQKKVFSQSLNVTWYSVVSDYKLDVLANDLIEQNPLETCVLVDSSNGILQKTNKTIFKEKAKAAGFTHSHRGHTAVRPHCMFDFIVPFYNSTKRAKLPGEFCTAEHVTGGAAVGDYDNDGLQDVFFSVFDKKSVLYKNMGNGKFKDVTTESAIGPEKYANGAVWVDIDQDGDLDLYVTSVGGSRHYMYVNYGGHFREEAGERNISLEFPSKRKLSGFTPSVGDFDQDGFPDIYVSEWILHSQNGLPSASRLMRNLGKIKPGYFEDVTDKAGVNVDHLWTKRTKLNAGTHTFGASFTDFDNDGLQELLITGDYGESRMFWNNGNMTFSDCTRACGLVGEVDAMGHAIGDWNNDGNLEWFSTAIFDNATNCEVTGCMFGNKGNKLFKNLGNKQFTDVSDYVGVRNGGWGWGAAFFDFNNDGYLDIVMTNGFDTPSTTIDDPYMKQRMKLFKNIGPNAASKDVGKMKEVASEYGMKFDGMGRGLLKFDYDNDGDEDVIIATNVGPAVFYENLGGDNNNWLRIQVVHRCGSNEKKLCDSYGARVVVQDPTGRKQTQEIGSSTHFLGQSEMMAHYGLLQYTNNITVRVTWPATKQTVVLKHVKARNVVRVVRPPLTSNRTSSMSFSALQKCPSLVITEVKTEPGALFSVVINPDKKSLQLKLHPAVPLTGLAMQTFSYKVKVNSNSSIVASASVTIDARVFIRNQTVSSICPSGRMWIPGMKLPESTTKRQYNGVSNNVIKVHWGAATETLRRLVPSKYSDDISMPAAACSKKERLTKTCPYPHELSGQGTRRPPPRVISNELFAQKESVESERGLSDLFVHYGQFIAHDLDFSSPLPRFEFQGSLNEVWMQISVPKGDPHFDQDGTGNKYLPFIRSTYNRCTGMYPNGYPREQVNKISSFIDATDVYGTTQSRCQKLRTMADGKLKLGPDGIIPKNDVGLDNDNPTGRKPSVLRVAGDTRANVAPGLIAFHTIFVKEHNRLCELYKKKNPLANDEEIFQYAKRIVIAEHQAIAFREYLPALVGQSNIPKYKGYNSSINPTVSNIFATAAFRFGHSQVNSHMFRFDKDWKVSKYGHWLLRESYFHPERVAEEGGIEPLIRGMIKMPAQKIDTLVVDELRNVLFPVGRGNGLDLAAMNIQRGRDHGLPDYNSVRKYLGLKGLSDFSEITKNKDVASKLKKLYKDINNIDLWVGGLAEDHQKGSELGETFQKIFIGDILRVRDGDRFWYEKIMSPEEIKMVQNLTLSNIIKLNTAVKDIPYNVFFSSKQCKSVVNHQCVHRETDDPKRLLQLVNKLKMEKQEANQEYQSSLKTGKNREVLFKDATVALGVVCAVLLLLFLAAAIKIVQTTGFLRRAPAKKSVIFEHSEGNGKTHCNIQISNGKSLVSNGKRLPNATSKI